MSGDRNTNRTPSMAALTERSSREPPVDTLLAGTSRIISKATMTKTNDIALKTYAPATLVAAITNPAAAGPTTDAA